MDRALDRIYDAGGELEQRGLAGSAPADQRHDFAAADFQIQPRHERRAASAGGGPRHPAHRQGGRPSRTDRSRTLARLLGAGRGGARGLLFRSTRATHHPLDLLRIRGQWAGPAPFDREECRDPEREREWDAGAFEHRPRRELGRGLEGAAFEDVEGLTRKGRLGLLVGTDDRAAARHGLTHDPPFQLPSRSRVQVREGLVEQEAARRRDKRGGKKGPGLLSRAQALGRALPERGQPEFPERRGGPFSNLAWRDPERFETERDLAFDGIREELRIGLFEEGADLGPEGAALGADTDLLVAEEKPAGARRGKPGEHSDEDGLAGSVSPEQEVARP